MSTLINEKIPYFADDGLACSESTLRYLIEADKIDLPITAVKMMTAMHGNMGRCANCGAINGGTAAIGSRFGRTEPGEDSKVAQAAVEAFQLAFESRFGSTKCATLVGDNDMASLEQQYRCSEYVLGAAEIVVDVIKQFEK